jgi:ZIP family zinc transporter
MVAVDNLLLVGVAGLVTALATGLGAIPFFLVDDLSDRWNVILWGLASGIMVSASVFGLLFEGLQSQQGSLVRVGIGVVAGVLLVVSEFLPEALETGRNLPNGGRPELAAGVLAGVVGMLPLLWI